MKQLITGWQVGFSQHPDAAPETMMPARVPGAVQADYARYHHWPHFAHGLNYRDYRWMEDVYWRYAVNLYFDALPTETAHIVFKGIDYGYHIRLDGELLCEGEGMFSHVQADVSRFAGRDCTLEVLLDPAPKACRTGKRNEARKSCKAAACYGWDWHPRLVTIGLWDEVALIVEDARSISALDASYTLSDCLDEARIDVQAALHTPCRIRFALLDGEDVAAETISSKPQASLTVSQPKLWYPHGYGSQHRYTLIAETLDDEGRVLCRRSRNIGFRRARLVMNEGAWKTPAQFPKSRSDAPATLEINGIKLFAKGSNWVNAQVFPGEMTGEHYERLLTLAKDANMNLLRVWGGGFVNKESFFDLCDEKGLMVWQEFPLACNEYPDEDDYLSVLRQEAVSIVRRLRTHPCVVLWCGGNELFNGWSGMTEQHHALRLLDSICYQEDRFTPFIMTSPLNGMAHGHYVNYDEEEQREFITDVAASRCTAYTEFGSPGAADPAYIKQYTSPRDYEDCHPGNEVWKAHHAFHAWGEGRWLRRSEAEYYFGGYLDTDDLCRKTQFIQSMCYKSLFEEMRKQWPLCSMALNWCLNEPWPTFANNSLISWPDLPRPAYEAVRQALRPSIASLRVDRHLWWAGETFHAEVWMLNESAMSVLKECAMTITYALGGGEEKVWGTLRCPALKAQENHACGGISFVIPEAFSGMISLRLSVQGHPEFDSAYAYPCRIRKARDRKDMLNI